MHIRPDFDCHRDRDCHHDHGCHGNQAQRDFREARELDEQGFQALQNGNLPQAFGDFAAANALDEAGEAQQGGGGLLSSLGGLGGLLGDAAMFAAFI